MFGSPKWKLALARPSKKKLLSKRQREWHEMTWNDMNHQMWFTCFLGFFRISRFIRFCPTQAPFEPWRPIFRCFFCLSWPPGNVAPWRTSMDTEPTWRNTQMSRRCCRLWARWPWVCSLQHLLNCLNWSLSMVPWKCGTNRKRRNKWTNCFKFIHQAVLSWFWWRWRLVVRWHWKGTELQANDALTGRRSHLQNGDQASALDPSVIKCPGVGMR